MSEVPDNVVNKSLYLKAKSIANDKYKRNGLFKSAFIVKTYKELGGKYRGEKTNTNEGIQRWLKGEAWIEVEPYLKSGKKVKCGSSDKKGKACRPSKRVNDKTPMTIDELIERHGKAKLLKLVDKKKKNMDLRINWKEGKIN